MTKEQIEDILLAKRIFPIRSKINNDLITEMEKALFQMFLQDDKKKAYLTIKCGGGEVQSALSGYDFIKSLPFEVECVIIGDCHSATLTLMAACTRRKATKHSRFLFHAMEYSPTFESTKNIQQQMEIRLKESLILYNQSLEIEQVAYNLSKKKLEKMRNLGEKYNVRLTAQEALDKKIIHEIVEKFDFFSPTI